MTDGGPQNQVFPYASHTDAAATGHMTRKLFISKNIRSTLMTVATISGASVTLV
jgi:hypothetical protein